MPKHKDVHRAPGKQKAAPARQARGSYYEFDFPDQGQEPPGIILNRRMLENPQISLELPNIHDVRDRNRGRVGGHGIGSPLPPSATSSHRPPPADVHGKLQVPGGGEQPPKVNRSYAVANEHRGKASTPRSERKSKSKSHRSKSPRNRKELLKGRRIPGGDHDGGAAGAGGGSRRPDEDDLDNKRDVDRSVVSTKSTVCLGCGRSKRSGEIACFDCVPSVDPEDAKKRMSMLRMDFVINGAKKGARRRDYQYGTKEDRPKWAPNKRKGTILKPLPPRARDGEVTEAGVGAAGENFRFRHRETRDPKQFLQTYEKNGNVHRKRTPKSTRHKKNP